MDIKEQIIAALNEYRAESEAARQSNVDRFNENFRTYLGKSNRRLEIKDRLNCDHDDNDETAKFSKVDVRNNETLPQTSIALESLCAFFRKAIVPSGKWFNVKVNSDQDLLTNEDINRLLAAFIKEIEPSFSKTFVDGLKIALLGGISVDKVHTRTFVKKMPVGGGRFKDYEYAMPAIDLVSLVDYYPDPEGNNLYEFVDVWVDLKDVIKNESYDKSEIAKLKNAVSNSTDPQQHEKVENKNQNLTYGSNNRVRVKITECYMTVLKKGIPVLTDNLCTVANDKFVLSYIDNPFWHGRSPFVRSSIVSVPYSVWQRGLFDTVANLNRVQDGLFNMMLDGINSMVWGIKQAYPHQMMNPGKYTNGIPYGETILLKKTAPFNVDVIKKVVAGQLPGEVFNMFDLVNSMIQLASTQNSIRLGQIPDKNVKATEIVESLQQSSVLLESISRDIEDCRLKPILEMVWSNIIQDFGSLNERLIINIIGEKKYKRLLNIKPEELYQKLTDKVIFEVNGLSSMIARVKEFSKLVSFFDIKSKDEMLNNAFNEDVNPKKLRDIILTALNIDKDDILFTEQEKDKLEKEQAVESRKRQDANAPLFGQGNFVDQAQQGAPSKETKELLRRFTNGNFENEIQSGEANDQMFT